MTLKNIPVILRDLFIIAFLATVATAQNNEDEGILPRLGGDIIFPAVILEAHEWQGVEYSSLYWWNDGVGGIEVVLVNDMILYSGLWFPRAALDLLPPPNESTAGGMLCWWESVGGWKQPGFPADVKHQELVCGEGNGVNAAVAARESTVAAMEADPNIEIVPCGSM